MATVLVVDDNEINRDLVRSVLGYAGHEVLQAEGAAAALEAARVHPPDLMITDLLMPGMDGYELVREIRADEALASMPVIFYTAHYQNEEVRPIASTLGVRHRLSKPVDARVLLHTVEEALGEPRSALPISGDFEHEHQRAVAAKLVSKVEELESTQVELQTSQAQFQTLSENAPVGIFSLDGNGQLTYANPCLLRICGLDDHADARGWGSLIHPGDRREVARAMARVVESGEGMNMRARIVTPDGAQRYVVVRVSQVVEGADAASFVGTLEDVTEAVEAQLQRDELQRRLQISERLDSLGHLAAGISHDFNNLLAVIANSAELVDDAVREIGVDRAPDEMNQVLQDVRAISAAAERASDLTGRLLVFARRDAPQRELVDVNATVAASLTLLRRTVPATTRLVEELGTGLPFVAANRGQLDQVIMNLVINARDATGGAGHIVVTTGLAEIEPDIAGAPAGQYVRITVADDGAGMDRETIEHAFEPFFTTKPVGLGTGLGLSTVYGIVTGMNGTVTIESEPNRGTAITVLLPAVS